MINTHITYVLLVDLTPPIGILLTITDEFLGIRALSSVYSVKKIKSWISLWWFGLSQSSRIRKLKPKTSFVENEFKFKRAFSLPLDYGYCQNKYPQP